MKKKVTGSFDQKQEFSNIARMVYWYTMKMKEHNLIDEVVIDNKPSMVNPYYGRVEAGSAYVVEYSRGVPAMIYSTLGAVEIPSAKMCRGYLNDYKAFRADVNQSLGQKELPPIVKNYMDLIGPRYIVTRIPELIKQKLPLECKFQNINPSVFQADETELREDIFRSVNAYFRKIGRVELVESGKTKAPVVEAVKQAPKKCFCMISGQLKQLIKQPFQKADDEKVFDRHK